MPQWLTDAGDKLTRWHNAAPRRLLPVLGGIALVVAVAVWASLWLLDQRVERIRTEVNTASANLTPAQPTQALRPLPDAWETVIDEIYRNQERPPRTRQADVDRPQYVKNARALPMVPPETPKIAIVIDDVGVNAVLSQMAEDKLPPEVTFSYLPYGKTSLPLAAAARQKGREVMIHLPMEPMPRPEEPPINPGEDALYVNLTAPEIRARVRKNLADLQEIAVGVNNHMGSRFTAYKQGLIPALEEINNAGLFFLDSLTTHKSAVREAAAMAAPEMPLLVRDIFLDHYLTEKALIDALVKLEDAARRDGKVIAIGHPHKRTVDVLENWIPTLKHKDIALVPISHILPENGANAPLLTPANPAKNPPQEKETPHEPIYPE